jgi:hypothetical protein
MARPLVEAEFDVNRNAAQLREVFQTAGKAHYAGVAQRAI